MGQSSSQQVNNGPNELPEDIDRKAADIPIAITEDDGPPVLKSHRRKDTGNEKPPQSPGDKPVSKRKRKSSPKASKDNNAREPQLPVAPVPSSSGFFRDEQDSRPSKRNRVSDPAQKEKKDSRKTDEGPGVENGTVKGEDTEQLSGLSNAVDAQPLEQPAKPKTSPSQKREAEEPTETKTKTPLSQVASNSYATNKEKPNRAHSSSKKETLTGFFTSEEVQLLENFKLEFSNNHRLTGETFDRMVQHSERDKVDFPCEPSIITKQDFWRTIYETIPRRDRRSVYRFMRRHFQASTQKPHHWTNEQDEELVSLHARYGPKWAFIAKLIGRNDDDVTQRWKNRLEHRGTMLRGPWSAEEIRALQDALKSSWENMKKTGHNVGKDIYEMEETLIGWGQVSDRMENKRSRQQCADKWRRIRQRILNLRAKGNPDATYEPTVELRSPKKPKPPAVTVEKQQPKYKSSEFVNSDEEDEDADGQGKIQPEPEPVKKEASTSESRSNSKTTSNTKSTSESDSDSDSDSSQPRQASVDKTNKTSTDKQSSQKRKRSPTPPKSSSSSSSDSDSYSDSSESDSSSSESDSEKQPPRKRQSADPASTTGADSSKPISKSPAAATVKDTNTSNQNNPGEGETSSSSESESKSESDSDSESESEPSGENAARKSSSNSSSEDNEKQKSKQNETTNGQKSQSSVKTNTHTSNIADASSSTDSSDSESQSESESESESEDEKDNPGDVNNVNKKSEEHAEKKPPQPQPPNRPSESSSSESESESDSESDSESEDEKETAPKPAPTIPQQAPSSSSSTKKDNKPRQPDSSAEDSDSDSDSSSSSSSTSSSSPKNRKNPPKRRIKSEATPSSSSSSTSPDTNTKPSTTTPPKTEPTPTPTRTSLHSIKQELKRERDSSSSRSGRGKPRVMSDGYDGGARVKKEEGDDEMVGVKGVDESSESSSEDSESESESESDESD